MKNSVSTIKNSSSLSYNFTYKLKIMKKNTPKNNEEVLQEALTRNIPPQDISTENTPISELLQKTLKALENLTHSTQEKK